MKSRRLSLLFAFVLVFNAIFAGFAFAEAAPTQNKQLKVVALGDSITFANPGFPDLINNVCQVTKFGGVGATTQSLLATIKNDTNFKVKAQEADVVTVNIGSNDFLAATGLGQLLKDLQPHVQNPASIDKAKVAEVLAAAELKQITLEQATGFVLTLGQILNEVKAQTDAPIILYNLYNPINPGLDLGDPALNAKVAELHSFVEQGLAIVNPIIKTTGSASAEVVDAYATFQGKEAAYVLPFDIHPTQAGHKALAQLADREIQALMNEGCSGPCGEEPPIQPEGCGQPEEPTPTPEPPKENPAPTPTPTPEQPKENPAPPVQKPEVKPQPAPVTKVEVVKATGSKLPDTATTTYNYLVLGLGLVFVGMVVFGLQQHRQRKNQGV